MFENKKEALKDKLRSLLTNKVNLLSSESFLRMGSVVNQAKRIKAIAPESKIIIVLRNPIKIIKSFYKYNVMREGFFLSLEECISWRRTPFVFYKRKPIYIAHFFYNETIEIYNKLFGADNVCILKYEDIQKNLFQFFQSMGSFMDIQFDSELIKEKQKFRINSSMPEQQISMQRYKNICEYFQRNFSVYREIMKYEEFAHNLEQDIIPSDLNERLEKAFSGKCYDYY